MNNIRNISSPVCLAEIGDSVLKCDASANAIAVTLYKAINGFALKIVKADMGEKYVTLYPATGDTIDGRATYRLCAPNDFITLGTVQGGWAIIDRPSVVHFRVAAADATVADTDGIHAARTCPAINVAATCVVKAASAVTDTLTVSSTVAIGASANALNILLTTAADDVLAVTKTDGTSTINIALAKTTAANNAAALVQAAIQALETVGGVDVSAFTCTAGGNWDTAAKATGETAAVAFTGGLSPIDLLTTAITQPSVPRNITATAGGTGGDIKAIQVTITGTNFLDEVISETLDAFSVNTAGSVTGAKAFKTVTSISIPAHDGLGATTAIGFGEVLGLWDLLNHNTVLASYLDNTVEATAATVTTSATAIESNTIDLNSTLDSKVIDGYYIR